MKRWLQGVLISCCFITAAHAATSSFYFNTEYSGAPAPVGVTTPLSATFTDLAAPNTVRLTLDATEFAGNENVLGTYFNLDPLLNSAQLSFTYVALSTGPAATTIMAGADCCNAGGGGKYDIRFLFPASSGFGAGDLVVYDIAYSGPGTLSASSFSSLGAAAGGAGPFLAAAHIRNPGAGIEGGWFAPASHAPEPSIWMMMLSALGIIALLRRYKA